MQNPFTRLKHYRVDKVDPKENHATECLAMCLQCSDEIRESFVEFLFEGMTAKPPPAAGLEIKTQRSAGEFGIPDLILGDELYCKIVVEVKVDDLLAKNQAEDYGKWLRNSKSDNRFLFSLEKNKYRDFDIEFESGVPGKRLKWESLYDWFRKGEKVFEPTASKVIGFFCDYLETEAIVSIWKPSEILEYGPGQRAEKALTLCFDRIASRLKKGEPDKSFIAESRMPSGAWPRLEQWPRLEIGLRVWAQTFGEGYQGRVRVQYETKGIWGSEEDRFSFCFYIWNGWVSDKWTEVQNKLPMWTHDLEAQGFKFVVEAGRRKEHLNAVGLAAINERPKSIEVWIKDDKCNYIGADEIKSMTDDALVNEIVRRVEELCAVVSKLK